jgi:hypothetical protein
MRHAPPTGARAAGAAVGVTRGNRNGSERKGENRSVTGSPRLRRRGSSLANPERLRPSAARRLPARIVRVSVEETNRGPREARSRSVHRPRLVKRPPGPREGSGSAGGRKGGAIGVDSTAVAAARRTRAVTRTHAVRTVLHVAMTAPAVRRVRAVRMAHDERTARVATIMRAVMKGRVVMKPRVATKAHAGTKGRGATTGCPATRALVATRCVPSFP